MTEQAPWSGPDPDADEPAEVPSGPPSPSSGVAAVDRVIGDLDGLEDLPIEEHLATFERAHGALRQALDAQSDDPV